MAIERVSVITTTKNQFFPSIFLKMIKLRKKEKKVNIIFDSCFVVNFF